MAMQPPSCSPPTSPAASCLRRIRKELKVGQPRAQEIRGYLNGLANGHGRQA